MYGESIYALIPPPDPVVEKPTMHRSIYPGKVDPRDFSMGVTKLSQHSTFGPPKEKNRTLPNGYLKKRTGEPQLPERTPALRLLSLMSRWFMSWMFYHCFH